LRQAIALEPSNARFYCHLGVALLEKNEIEPAREAFTEAIRHKSDFALPHYELGKVMAREKKFVAAAEELETSIRLQPDLAPARYELSRVYAALGQKQRAQDSMAEFLALKARQSAEQEELASDATKQLQNP
jgi:uncharacterized protein HemY